MKMKKIMLTLAVFALVISSCKKEEKSSQQVKDEIYNYKEKIAKLEKQLAKTNTHAETVASVKVKYIEVKKKETKHTIDLTGSVSAENSAFVTPEMNGQIKRIYIKEGQRVRKGQLLVSLNSSVIVNSIQELKTGLELAKVLYKKQKGLWDQKVGKEIDYLKAKNQKESLEAKLKTLQAQYAMTQVKAPFSGIVDEIHLKQGELASPGRPLIDLINLSRLDIEADISEKYLPILKKGDSVTISFPAFPGLVVQAKIYRLGNTINPINRTFKIQIKINNKGGKIKPNMIAKINITDYSGNDISVPSICVKNDRKGKYVYVAESKNEQLTAKKRYVETGFSIGKNVIVKKGLSENDKVITEGYNLVTNGTFVTN